ncbi:MAG TPA: M1 family peptidase, partial [Arthrobacter sp.]|nr:M1 family peptidase [Arthrobacter sp.]
MSPSAPSGSGSGLPTDEQASAPDPYLPGHGTAAYRVTRYELELDYKVSSNRLSGRAVLHAVAQLPTSAVVLDLAGLRATRIQLSGRKARKFSPRAEQLIVVPEAPLLPGEAFTVDIRYEGNPAPRRGL